MSKKNYKLSDENYSWMSGNWKTEVSRGGHGDIYIGQTTGKIRRGFGYYDSGWIVAPIILLSYVNDVRADAREMENWREYMTKYGWEIPERFGDLWDYEYYFKNSKISRIDENSSKNEFENFPNFIQSAGLHGPDVFPVIGINDDLIFLVEHVRKDDKPVPISIRGRNSKFKECFRIPKTDANYLFRGIVHFSNGFRYGSSERMDNLAKILIDWEAARKG